MDETEFACMKVIFGVKKSKYKNDLFIHRFSQYLLKKMLEVKDTENKTFKNVIVCKSYVCLHFL